ncbi:MAG TPA: DUF4388 domain-containing protein [Deltaproteobacteria bacterium]|nr:DUF4388 domain-containing protein [Deltaproteobacteria bacterium]
MARVKALLALSDERERSLFYDYLSARGFELIVACDGAEAVELATRLGPDLAIVDINMPTINGERIFHLLRTSPHASGVHFVLIADTHVELKGFNQASDLLFLRPLYLDEVYGRLMQMLSAGERRSRGSSQIAGDLAYMSLPDLLQMLQMNRREGELRIEHGSTRGVVTIKDGDVYNATYGNTAGEKAFYRLMGLHEGKFEFVSRPVTEGRRLRGSTESLMMEGSRQIDELAKLMKSFPIENSLVKVKVDPKTLPEGLQPVIYETLSLAGLYRKVSDIVENASHPDFIVYQTVLSLMKKGILEEVKAGESGDALIEAADEARVMERIAELTGEVAAAAGPRYRQRGRERTAGVKAKLFVAAPGPGVLHSFIDACKPMPEFFRSYNRTCRPGEEAVGEAGSIKLRCGLELVLFLVPTVEQMGPLWRAFSSDLAGLFLVLGGGGAQGAAGLAAMRRDILSRRRLPVLHIVRADGEDASAEELRSALGLGHSEELHTLDPHAANPAQPLFRAYFDRLLREEAF